MSVLRATVTAPVIVIGMHRSGTSMVSRALERLGTFMGERKQKDHEARFFLQLNDWLLHRGGARWDDPEPFLRLLDEQEIVEMLVEDLDRYLHTVRAAEFLGWRTWLAKRDPRALDRSWGWKDPRNTFTLPIWLALFPNAKVIHVQRHGVDVAHSLVRRESRNLQAAVASYRKRRRFHRLSLPRRTFASRLRCTTLEGSLSLWETYMHRARALMDQTASRGLSLRYEDLLQDPLPHIREVAEFCELPIRDRDACALAEDLDGARAFAHRRSPELHAYARRVASRLETWGYGA